MISADAARKLSDSKITKDSQEAEEVLNAAITAACQLGERNVNLHKRPVILRLAHGIALRAGYTAVLMPAIDQRDQDYLKVEW